MSNNSSADEFSDGLSYILLFRLIIWGYVGMVLSLFGIFGNIITVLVLISPSMRTTSTNIYLTALSCSNVVFLLIFIPSYSMRYLLGYELYKTNQPPFAFEILLAQLPTTPIYNTILLSIIYLTVAVSLDRLITVQFPLKAKRILTLQTTVTTILLIYVFSVVYCIPYWLEQKYVPEKKMCELTSIGKKIHKYTRIYIYIPVVYLIPFTTLTCINITIIQNLIAKKRRKISLCGKSIKKKQGDYHITLMLVTVIIVFVLCQLPLLILNAWYAIDPRGSRRSILFHSLNSIGVLLVVFNTSTNFFLYCFFGQKFRQALVEYILRVFPRHNIQTNLQPKVSRLSKEQQQQPKSPEKDQLHEQQIPTGNSSLVTNSLNISKTITTEFDQQILNEKLDHVLHRSSSINQEESCPLIRTSEVVILNEQCPPKTDQQLRLYTSTNGKRIVALKI